MNIGIVGAEVVEVTGGTRFRQVDIDAGSNAISREARVRFSKGRQLSYCAGWCCEGVEVRVGNIHCGMGMVPVLGPGQETGQGVMSCIGGHDGELELVDGSLVAVAAVTGRAASSATAMGHAQVTRVDESIPLDLVLLVVQFAIPSVTDQ